MENITQKFWHIQNGPPVLNVVGRKAYWEVNEKQVTELCLCTAVCMESRHQQHNKDKELSSNVVQEVGYAP